MTSEEKLLCNGIIHSASAAAAAVGGGLAQVPTSDNVIITPIQLTMAVSLGKVFGITLDQSAAKVAVASAAAATVGRTASQVLIGWIPGIGNIINAATAASITEAIGWILANEFESQSVIGIGTGIVASVIAGEVVRDVCDGIGEVVTDSNDIALDICDGVGDVVMDICDGVGEAISDVAEGIEDFFGNLFGF